MVDLKIWNFLPDAKQLKIMHFQVRIQRPLYWLFTTEVDHQALLNTASVGD